MLMINRMVVIKDIDYIKLSPKIYKNKPKTLTFY